MKNGTWLPAAAIAVGLIATVSPAQANWLGAKVKGSGKIVSEARTVPPFEQVHSSGSAKVVITVGPAQHVEIKTDDNIIPIVETKVRDGRLEIETKDSWSSDTGITVTISTPTLKGVGLSGSGDVRVSGVSGGAFAAALSGSGDITASGTAEKVSVAISGSGDAHLYDLAARTAEISVSGSGDVEVSASEVLDASIAGSGDVSYRGKPQVKSHVAGSGDVHPAS